MDELINFEIAKLAKEVGFKEACLNYFTLDGDGKYFGEDMMFYYSNGANGRLVLRPTRAQLQDWLREEKGIHIEILLEDSPTYDKYYFRILKVGKYFALSHSGEYSTFGNTMDNALLEVLNKIKEND